MARLYLPRPTTRERQGRQHRGLGTTFEPRGPRRSDEGVALSQLRGWTAAREKGTSDPIDAHLAVLAALRLDAERLPMPRADGDREALRIRSTLRLDDCADRSRGRD